MLELVAARYVYVVVLVLLSVGLYGMLAARNLVRKIIAMTIFQTAIYLFFIEGSVKLGATVPVIDPALGSDPAHYVNPLPHLLILTAIVVGVAVVGVALSLLIRIHRAHGSLDEAVVVSRLSGSAAEARRAGEGADDQGAGDG
jgi:multicomponent Na+:H+ antiporter subunit C